MMFGRKSVTAAIAALAMAMSAAAFAQTQAPKTPPVVYSAEVNMCRASCGSAWIQARTCNNDAAVCLKRADRSYKQCLPDCLAGKAPLANSFAWLRTQRRSVSATPMRPGAKPESNGPDSTADAPWVDARTQWLIIPSQTPVTLPHTFAVAPSAFTYAGQTREIRPFVTQTPGLLKIELVVIEGQVGVALVTPDGSALLSKEAALKPSPAVQSVYFEIGPHLPPIAMVVRNYNAEGVSGAVTVRAVTFARARVLPAGEAERLGALK